jgi:hypothetical protein
MEKEERKRLPGQPLPLFLFIVIEHTYNEKLDKKS